MTKSERKAIGKVLRRAAERIANKEERLCCTTLVRIEGSSAKEPSARTLFNKLYKQSAKRFKAHNHDYWFREREEDIFCPKVRLRRSIGLLLCAEVVEDGSWP